jgi:hypothetical protein
MPVCRPGSPTNWHFSTSDALPSLHRTPHETGQVLFQFLQRWHVDVHVCPASCCSHAPIITARHDPKKRMSGCPLTLFFIHGGNKPAGSIPLGAGIRSRISQSIEANVGVIANIHGTVDRQAEVQNNSCDPTSRDTPHPVARIARLGSRSITGL